MSKQAVIDILIEAKQLIAIGWTQEAFARDGAGNSVASTSAVARCWCSLGAIYARSIDRSAADFEGALEALREIVGESISDWNDNPSRTPAEVIATFDRAIKSARAA